MAEITNELRTWVADNIIAGSPPESITHVLEGLGIAKEVAAKEVAEAASHPYIESGKKYHAKLSRREALMKTLDKLHKTQDNYLKIKKIPLPPLADFLRDYYYQNRAGFFSGGFDDWPALKWDLRKLVEKVGAEAIVEIQFGRDQDKNYESNSHNYKRKIKFGEFIEMVEKAGSTNNFYLTAANQVLANSDLKVLLNDMGNLGDGYFDMSKKEAGMFLWIGPKGSITPLHHDLTNSIFLQLYGKKTMRMIPSLQVPNIYNNLHVFSDVDLLNPKPEKYPEFKKTDIIELNVIPGDCVFIPIGWWHHVVGESISISMTLTNINAKFNEFVDHPSAAARY